MPSYFSSAARTRPKYVTEMREVMDGGAGVADLHVHTHHSDGQDSPSEVLAWAARIGLDVVAITDHDVIDCARIAAELARQDPDGCAVIVGEEVSSRDGHVLALFIDDLVPPDLRPPRPARPQARTGDH